MMAILTVLVVIALIGFKTYELVTYKSYKEKLRKMDEEIEKDRQHKKEKEDEHIFVGSMDTHTIIRHVGETDVRKYRSKRPGRSLYSVMSGSRKSGRLNSHMRRNNLSDRNK